MSILNIIASNWSFEERERLNQNWSIIENYLSNLQGQIRILSGDEDVTEIIDRLNNALTQGESTLEELQTALIDATTVINNAQTATDNANDAAQGALNAITDIQNIINDFGSKGEYDNNVSYKRNNIVYKDGCSYIYINEVASSGNTPPPYPTISNAHWHMLAEKGASGSGAVSKVNGKDPNGSGEIILTPNDIGAASNENLIQLQGQVTTHLDNYTSMEINLYISSAGNDNNDGLTQNTAIATNGRLNELLNKYKVINSVVVNVLSDIDRITITNQYNVITVQNSVGNGYKFKLSAFNCRDIRVNRGVSVTDVDDRLFEFYDVNKVTVLNSKFQPVIESIGIGIYLDRVANFYIDGCVGNYLKEFLSGHNSQGLAHLCSGSENVVGYSSRYGATLTVLGNTLIASTLEIETDGGVIRS